MSWRVDHRAETMGDMAHTDTTSAPATGGEKRVGQPAKRYKLLYMIAGTLAVIGIVSAIAIIVTRGDQPNPQTPPPVNSTSGTTPSASTTPTSPDDKAASDASVAFVAYIRATDQLGHDGGARATEAKVMKLTTSGGTEQRFIKIYAKDLRARQLRSTGWSEVTTRVDSVDLTHKPPRVDLAACVDQRSVKATEHGKPAEVPRFLLYGATLHLVDGKWMIDRVENTTADLHPTPRESCSL